MPFDDMARKAVPFAGLVALTAATGGAAAPLTATQMAAGAGMASQLGGEIAKGHARALKPEKEGVATSAISRRLSARSSPEDSIAQARQAVMGLNLDEQTRQALDRPLKLAMQQRGM